MSINVRSVTKWIISIFAVWLVCIALYLTLSINASFKRAANELNEAGFLLHRMISQRAAQHDAHMTTLASLIQADGNKQPELLAQVSDSIMRFYQRIKALQEIEITWHDSTARTDVRQIWSTPADASLNDEISLGRRIFVQKAGEGKSYVSPSSDHDYLLTKKLKDSNPALALVMHIDPKQLIDIEELPDWAHLQLLLDGATIMEQGAAQHASGWLQSPHFERMIDSQSQPLRLIMERPLSLSDLVEVIPLLIVAITSLAVLLLLGYSLRHSREVRRLQIATDMAEQRNTALERETRLAHAERVNSLGELASGIAHELAQPLTALMSQSRAAERLFEQSGMDNILLKKTMAANVREARRAGDMLKRMRDYISKRPPKPVSVTINNVINDTVELLRPDLEQRHIALRLTLDSDLPELLADPVELTQVLNNLIRNAADSLQTAGTALGQITIETLLEDKMIKIEISDNGPGFTADLLPRLFEPFFTTKKDGMGLGLALCARLIERVGGHIEAHNKQTGGACFIVTLPIPQGRANT